MGDILYEASFKFDLMWLILIIMLIFIPLFPVIIKKAYKDIDLKIGYRIVKIFCWSAFAFVAVISIVVGIGYAHMYNETVGAYHEGNYQVVEGYVENFIPMPEYGRSDESFEINGVKFSYSNYEIQPGYNNAKSHGGVITGDGQHLKIGYVYYDRTYGNIIVYIEQLS